jgi:hypothetical protein
MQGLLHVDTLRCSDGRTFDGFAHFSESGVAVNLSVVFVNCQRDVSIDKEDYAVSFSVISRIR